MSREIYIKNINVLVPIVQNIEANILLSIDYLHIFYNFSKPFIPCCMVFLFPFIKIIGFNIFISKAQCPKAFTSKILPNKTTTTLTSIANEFFRSTNIFQWDSCIFYRLQDSHLRWDDSWCILAYLQFWDQVFHRLKNLHLYSTTWFFHPF